MKKFYKAVTTMEKDGGFAVFLDERPVKTPLKKTLLSPTMRLAQAIAEEWRGQGGEIKPDTMPLTQLLSTQLDKVETGERVALEKELFAYAETDLICYYASHPEDLVKRQRAVWQPVHDWLQEQGIELLSTQEMRHVQQPDASMDKVRSIISSLNNETFTAFQCIAPLLGSVMIGLMLVKRACDAQTAYAAAVVDDLYQLDVWGDDTQARQRLERIKAEAETAERFLMLSEENT